MLPPKKTLNFLSKDSVDQILIILIFFNFRYFSILHFVTLFCGILKLKCIPKECEEH